MDEEFSLNIIKEINKVRSNPKEYSQNVKNNINCFQGKVLKLPESKIGIITKEGPDAYIECAKFLETVSPIQKLKINESLNKIAKEFLNKIQNTEINEIDNIDMEKIIDKYGNFSGSFSRAIDFGGNSPKNVICNLLVSDGDKNRSQRERLFNNELKLIGAASGKHKSFSYCSVIVCCEEFYENEIEDEEKEFSLDNDNDKKKFMNEFKKKKSGIKDNEDNYNFNNFIKNNHLNNNFEDNENFVNDEDENDMIGVKKIKKEIKEIVEKGKRKKLIKIIKIMEDGMINTEITKESIDD